MGERTGSGLGSFGAEMRRMAAPLRCRLLVAVPSVGALGGVALARLTTTRTSSAAVLALMLERAHYELGWQLMASVWLVGLLGAALVGPFLAAEALAGERDRGALPLRVMLSGPRAVVLRRAAASWCWLVIAMVAALGATALGGWLLSLSGAIDTNVESPAALAAGFTVTVAVASGSWAVSLLVAVRASVSPAVVAGTGFYLAGVIVRELTGFTLGVLPAVGELNWIRTTMMSEAFEPAALAPGVAWLLLGTIAAATAAAHLRVE